MSKNKKRIRDGAIQYFILLKSSKKFYKLWSIQITPSTWDIYFFPSFPFHIPISEWEIRENRKILHLSYHASWEWHFVVEEWTLDHRISKVTTCIIELWKECNYWTITDDISEKRTPIKGIQYQDMFSVYVRDYSTLKQFNKKVDDIDLIFDVTELSTKTIVFKFSIISWSLILQTLNETSKVTKIKFNNDHQSITRCLWDESGNADKLLQYSVNKTDPSSFEWSVSFRFFYDHPLNT